MRYAAIPTEYKGIRFRSRLEARWAACFDGLEWPWVYEPYDMDGWIPDFEVTAYGDKRLVEIKPLTSLEELARYARTGRQVKKAPAGTLVLGAYPFPPDIGVEVCIDRKKRWTCAFMVPGPGLEKAWPAASNATQYKGASRPRPTKRELTAAESRILSPEEAAAAAASIIAMLNGRKAAQR